MHMKIPTMPYEKNIGQIFFFCLHKDISSKMLNLRLFHRIKLSVKHNKVNITCKSVTNSTPKQREKRRKGRKPAREPMGEKESKARNSRQVDKDIIGLQMYSRNSTCI